MSRSVLRKGVGLVEALISKVKKINTQYPVESKAYLLVDLATLLLFVTVELESQSFWS